MEFQEKMSRKKPANLLPVISSSPEQFRIWMPEIQWSKWKISDLRDFLKGAARAGGAGWNVPVWSSRHQPWAKPTCADSPSPLWASRCVRLWHRVPGVGGWTGDRSPARCMSPAVAAAPGCALWVCPLPCHNAGLAKGIWVKIKTD